MNLQRKKKEKEKKTRENSKYCGSVLFDSWHLQLNEKKGEKF